MPGCFEVGISGGFDRNTHETNDQGRQKKACGVKIRMPSPFAGAGSASKINYFSGKCFAINYSMRYRAPECPFQVSDDQASRQGLHKFLIFPWLPICQELFEAPRKNASICLFGGMKALICPMTVH